MTKEEFKEMERIYIQWLHEHQKGDYSYKAFSHMSRTLEFAKYWSKLHQPTVISAVCDNCRDVQGMYLGMTCPKCNRPFRDVKQTDL